jgi:nucleoside-specific outer membrane channel protein Tsx
MNKLLGRPVAAAILLLAQGAAHQALAMDWSDTSLGYRFGTQFAEPYNTADIRKHIVFLTHASGYQYGSNFLNLDVLKSDGKDANATEAYLVYRHTLDIGKLSARDLHFGPVRGVGLTAGFDWNTKNDPGYSSRKRMLVAGPTLMLDVPGFLNISLLALWESNEPKGVTSRYTYDTHAMLTAAWGIPLQKSGWSFDGYINYIGTKGRNEFGGPTGPETNLDMQLMYDLSGATGMKANTLKAGIAYQYWRNKFGNPSDVPGSLAKTPMVRAEYHF